jgi:arginase
VRNIRILGVASGAGAPDPGTARGPWALRHAQAFRAVTHRPGVDWADTLYARPGLTETPLARVRDVCERLAAEVRETLEAAALPVVIGGDHSIAIGTWSGARAFLGAAGVPGLLWLDAHMDSHTPQTTYSGALHGMPLACLLGVGDKRLVRLGGVAPKLLPAYTALLGARSYEAEEAEFLARQGVRVYDAAELERRGFDACLPEALAIARRAPAGWGISIDLDFFDPASAPGVGCAEPDGPQPGRVLAMLRALRGDPALLAVEITEFNPDRDIEGRTAALVAALVGALLPA